MLSNILVHLDFFWDKHGLLAWIAWFCLGFITYAANRWLVVFWRYALVIHVVTALAVMSVTLWTALAALDRNELSHMHLHNYFGLVTLILVCLLCFQGSIALLLKLGTKN